MESRIKFQKDAYSRDAIMIALQKYLDEYWVKILSEKDDFIIVIEEKNELSPKINQREFFNQLVEAEFLSEREKKSKELRKIIMQKALSPYS
jgi:His-Xaa-Ser system protein HxsD